MKSVVVIANSYAVKSGLEENSEVGSGRNQVVNKIDQLGLILVSM